MSHVAVGHCGHGFVFMFNDLLVFDNIQERALFFTLLLKALWRPLDLLITIFLVV